MGNFCVMCGRTLQDGEVCNCQSGAGQPNYGANSFSTNQVIPDVGGAAYVNNMGNNSNKKSKKPIIIAVIIAAIVICVGVVVLITMLGGDDKTDSESGDSSNKVATESGDYSKADKEKIEGFVSAADSKAAERDFGGAYIEINTALIMYPESEELKKELEKYVELLKTENLSKAAELANDGKYNEAMTVIKDAQEAYGDNADYQKAYESYSKSIKSDAISKAEEFAQNKDYLSALKTINDAISLIGADTELTAKAKEYEDAYVADVISKVDAMLADDNIGGAKSLIQEAKNNLPNNQTIKTRFDELDEYKSVLLNTLTPINGGFTWNEGNAEDPFQNSYLDLQNYTILHPDNSFAYGHGATSKNHSVEYQIDKKYDTLFFKTVPYSDCGEAGWSYIRIYADGSLRYTSDKVTQKTQPYSVSVDVSGATDIKIVVHTAARGCTMLMDMTLLKNPDFKSNRVPGYTSLSTLNVFNGSFPWENEYPENTLKSSYNSVNNYAVLHAANSLAYGHGATRETYSAEYYVNKQYSSISFDIAPSSDFGSDGSSKIKVYVDDTLVYTSKTVTQKTARFNTGVINTSQASYIKIVVDTEPHGCTIISDVLLKNK